MVERDIGTKVQHVSYKDMSFVDSLPHGGAPKMITSIKYAPVTKLTPQKHAYPVLWVNDAKRQTSRRLLDTMIYSTHTRRGISDKSR